MNMRTKIVYVLVSSEKDAYLEEALISIYSLRKFNPDATIEIIVDDETNKTLIGKRLEVLKYISNIVVINVDNSLSGLEKSRYIKTNVRDYIDGDYLYLDTDTVITGDLSDIDNFQYDIGSVPDKHVNIGRHPFRENIDYGAKLLGWQVIEENNYYNGGVVFSRDNEFTRRFFARWHELWKEHRNLTKSDQPSLAKTSEEFNYPIHELDGVWNCQVVDNGLKYLQEAKIIHYFASNLSGKQKSPYLFFSKDVTDKVKESGKITPEIDDMILHARSAFADVCRVISNDDMPFMMSSIHNIYLNYPKMFKALNSITAFYLRVANKLKRLTKG